MSVASNLRAFEPPGPQGEAFLRDDKSFVRALLGPVGGGKSSCCVFDVIRQASLMPICRPTVDDARNGRPGSIRFKLAIIGQTYGQLERNLFPTWKRWLPVDDGPGGNWTIQDFKGGGGRYATHKIEWDVERLIDGKVYRIPVFFEAIFAAIGDQVVEEFMRGFEPSAFWLYEVDLLPESVLDQAIFRLGRYPSRADLPEGSTYRSYAICDLNAPDVDSWFYRKFEEEKPEGFRLYKQPSGLSKNAENLHNLPPGYYDRQVSVFAGMKNGKNLIKRMVHAQYAPSVDGEPVFPEYSDDIHLAREVLKPVKGIPLEIGVDAGIQRPAAVIGQTMPSGQDRILGEVVPGRCGAARFAEAIKREIAELAALAGLEYLEIGSIWSDPWGFTGADHEAGELAWAERLMVELGTPILPTETNEIDPRLEAVREDLVYMIDAETPAMIISPRAKMVRKGLASHYRFQKVRIGNSERTADLPEKNEYSDPLDALQYKKLGKKGRWSVVGKKRGARDKASDGRNKPASSGATVIKDGGMGW